MTVPDRLSGSPDGGRDTTAADTGAGRAVRGPTALDALRLSPGRGLRPGQVLALQRSIGNRATSRRLLQRTPPTKDASVPLAVRFDTPLTREEFIHLADAQLKLDPARGDWQNVKERYEKSESPVRVWVSATMLTERRAAETASTVGLALDASGAIAGSQERARELSSMTDSQLKHQVYDEVDRRYWLATTGGTAGQRISSRAGEPGNAALWDEIRDEVLAQRAFIENLPDKARQVLRRSVDGVVLSPAQYEQIVRIAEKVERLDTADLENYLTGATTTKDLDALERVVKAFVATKAAAPQTLKDLLGNAADGDWDVDSEAALLDARTMFYLTLEQRLQIIDEVAGGLLVGDTDEQTLIRLLTSTPSGDVKGLLAGLKADGARRLKRLEKVTDGEENKLYYAALRNLVFKAMTPGEGATAMTNARTLPWSDPGLLKGYTNVRFSYETVEYTGDGKIRVVYWTSIAGMGMKNPEQLFEPDEVIAVRFELDEDFAGAVKGETVFMPAANMLAFKNEQFSRELSLIADVALLFAGGAGLFAKGTRLARAIALLDTVMAAAAITINSFRSDIAKTAGGKTFLRAWDTVNTLIAVYGLAKIVIHLPQTFRNLRSAYREFSAKPGDLDPNALRALEAEAQKLLAQADAAVAEAEVAQLRSKFPADRLKAAEPLLERAAAITDAAKRRTALADIEQQLHSQQQNLNLIEELKAANPKASNKQIADLAAPRIQVPAVPHGMDAEQFARAQALMKQELAAMGVADVEGFATGSRVTGVTFNPKKKATFGSAGTDFSGKDLDITLITPKELSNGQLRRLEDAFEKAFKFPLGIRNVVDRRELNFIPVYGKIPLAL